MISWFFLGFKVSILVSEVVLSGEVIGENRKKYP
jgi:hypothetical protein